MLINYYFSDNINAPFENFALSLENAWAGFEKSIHLLTSWKQCFIFT